MLWLLARVSYAPMLSHGLNCVDTVIAISQIPNGKVLNHHIYNTAINSIEKDKRPSLKIWDATNTTDFMRGVWMNKFVTRSGQYHNLYDSSSTQDH